MYFTFILFVSTLSFANCKQLIPNSGINYGPYEVNWAYYGLCEGVKLPGLCGNMYFEKENGKYIGISNVSFSDNTQVEVVKISVYTGNDESNVLWKYIIKKPCQHVIVAPILKNYYGIDKSCILKKGIHYARIGLSDVVTAFLGSQFFYGEFTFKTTVLTKKYTILCLLARSKFTKKQ